SGVLGCKPEQPVLYATKRVELADEWIALMLRQRRKDHYFVELGRPEQEQLDARTLGNSPAALFSVPDVADQKAIQINNQRVWMWVRGIRNRIGKQLFKRRLLKLLANVTKCGANLACTVKRCVIFSKARRGYPAMLVSFKVPACSALMLLT